MAIAPTGLRASLHNDRKDKVHHNLWGKSSWRSRAVSFGNQWRRTRWTSIHFPSVLPTYPHIACTNVADTSPHSP